MNKLIFILLFLASCSNPNFDLPKILSEKKLQEIEHYVISIIKRLEFCEKKLDKRKFESIILLNKRDILYRHLVKEGLKPRILKLAGFEEKYVV